MDFGLSFEERQVEETVRKLVKKKILPVKKELDAEAFFEYLSKSEINLEEKVDFLRGAEAYKGRRLHASFNPSTPRSPQQVYLMGSG
ncbi:MAG: acyl-CoA/acyl-ACP dehydrogenase [Deltaproteobacteria bacterium]|nr:acyl-CoA/acyl-ACP dehydrogenase [Deltaproteobacteria bacterium]MBW2083676.1 acyl-CoA/acyl-ACP dehydrogenase [Deltaproteobacteria bacterium]HDM10606.1 acyl-CoA dehydrogenase [Desulfobacteraceae bacterium]